MTHKEKFENYHSANPHIYEMFVRIAKKLIAKGYKNYSARDILPIMRWETKTKADGDRYKINNNYSADYARMFMGDYPKHDGFFELRQRKAV